MHGVTNSITRTSQKVKSGVACPIGVVSGMRQLSADFSSKIRHILPTADNHSSAVDFVSNSLRRALTHVSF